jgi:nitrogen fixation protein NifU and related proteins
LSTQELYQQVILDHNRKPRNFKKLEPCSHKAEGFNPLCGDHLWVYLNVNENGVIEEASFEGSGCAISKASASMMTSSIKGKTMAEAQVMFTEFQELLTGKLKPETDAHVLGKLKIFSGIWQFPSRVKCAALAWHAMSSALCAVNSTSTE